MTHQEKPKRPRKQIKLHFHEAAWNEPLIMQMGHSGERGVWVPDAGEALRAALGDDEEYIPAALRRKDPPNLPELAQPNVLRHYSRLSQMVLGNNVANNLGLATATMKYSPPVHEILIRETKMRELHPEQHEETTQGMLELIFRCGQLLSRISGMSRFSFQPGGGAPAIFANALIVRAFHRARGQEEMRDEVITTLNSHPANSATAATAGFKVITLYPDEKGYPPLDALKAAVSERTAALLTTNPEDLGLFNPEIEKWVEVLHAAGGLCVYDQANANGIVGVTRARDTGFDLCHFNLHKTFSVPHGSYGGGCGALGVREGLEEFLPRPTVEFDGSSYYLDYERPKSVGVVRSFHGNPQAVVKAYAWIMSMGAKGLREVAEVAVLNNNYLAKKIRDVPGAAISYPGNEELRIEQARYSWEQLTEDTGVGTEDIRARIIDFGVQTYWPSHHPYTVPEPFSLEPTESVSRDDLDEFYEILHHVAEEAYTRPAHVKTAPHRSTTRRPRADAFRNPAITWRAHLRRTES